MKTTTAFNILTSIRQDRSNAKKCFMVKSLTKSGEVSKSKPSQIAWQLDATVTREECEVRKANLEKLNPTKKFVIVEL